MTIDTEALRAKVRRLFHVARPLILGDVEYITPKEALEMLEEIEALRASKERWRSLAMATVFRTPNYSELSAEVDALRQRVETAERMASIPPAHSTRAMAVRRLLIPRWSSVSLSWSISNNTPSAGARQSCISHRKR